MCRFYNILMNQTVVFLLLLMTLCDSIEMPFKNNKPDSKHTENYHSIHLLKCHTVRLDEAQLKFLFIQEHNYNNQPMISGDRKPPKKNIPTLFITFLCKLFASLEFKWIKNSYRSFR